MKRQLRREERRSDILKSAAGVFSKDGYHKAKMEDISKAAGIGKGTIYLYFESKRQLFYSMIKEGTDQLLSDLHHKIQGEKDLENILKTIIKFTMDVVNKNKDITKLIISRPGTVDEDMQEWLSKQRRKIIEFLANLIGDSISKDKCTETNCILAAHSFLGMLLALLGEHFFNGSELFDLDSISDNIIHLFLHGIKG